MILPKAMLAMKVASVVTTQVAHEMVRAKLVHAVKLTNIEVSTV
jgi:hypothetical protein